MVFKKIIFQNRYVALETPPSPFMANTILDFHFDYWNTSLINHPWKVIASVIEIGEKVAEIKMPAH